MRNFPQITIGRILEQLNAEIAERLGRTDFTKVGRITLYRKQKELNFPEGKRSSGRWRIYTPEEATEIIDKVLQDMRIK